jgi:glycolate oxidase
MSTYNKVTPEVIAALQKVVGAENVKTDPETLDRYKTDEETDPSLFHLPEVVVLPANTKEVAGIMKVANKFVVPVTPRSAGTSVSDGAIPTKGGIVLLMEKMNKIIEINEAAMYMTVEAGVLTKDIQEAAKAKNLLYAGDPCSADSCMIGGNIATNAGGNRAVRYGTTRDQIYAIEVVTPTGDIVNLGARLKKKSTGYCLEQLVMGSEGTLGIITKAVLKLQPLPPYRLDLLAIFTDLSKAVTLVPNLIKKGLNPTSVEFMDNKFVRSSSDYCETKLPHYEDGYYLIVTIETFNEEELDTKMEQLDEICENSGAVDVLEADDRVWNLRRNCLESTRSISLIGSSDDLVVPVDQIATCINHLMEVSKDFKFELFCLAHAGDGNLHFQILKGNMTDKEWEDQVNGFHAIAYPYVYKLGGRLSGEHGIGAKKVVAMEKVTNPVELNMMRNIKKALDPLNILNPGKVFNV